MNWEPAKFDVKNASDIIVKNNNNDNNNDDENSLNKPIDLSENTQIMTEKNNNNDIWSRKNFLKMGKKMVKQISQTTNIIKADLMGNSPKPSPQPPLSPIDIDQTTEKNDINIINDKEKDQKDIIENNDNDNNDKEIEKDEKEIENEAMDKFDAFQSLQSVQSMDYKQRQKVARARRKSSANQQIFNEVDEQEPIKMITTNKTKKSKKKLKKKKSKSKAKFASIDPAPKIPILSQSKDDNNNNNNNDNDNDIDNDDNDNDDEDKNISITVKPGTGSILDINPNIKPHEVIYDDDGKLMQINENNDDDNDDNNNNNNDNNNDNDIDINKIHKLLKETSKCDILLRRRMRNELEDDEDDDVDDDNKYNKLRKVGLSNINYVTCPLLMNLMSNLLGEYEKISELSFGALQDILFYKWRNKIGEKLSTVLTRMLCVFISVKIDIGKESEESVLEILKKFLLILDFKWVLKLCNTHKLFMILRQLALLQYKQNNISFNRIEIEKTYLMQNYKLLIKLISKYNSPLLLLQYLPLLCEKCDIISDICIQLCVAYFPYISPWFIRKYMYRLAQNNNNKKELFKSYLKYLKLLFNIHPRTRCNGLIVLDLITLTLSINYQQIIINNNDNNNNNNILFSDFKNKIPKIHSENKYNDNITKYIISIINDKSYYIEWSYLEIIFKQYGFWKGLYKIYFHFQDIKSLIKLCIYLDYAQPILSLLCDLSNKKYWKQLIISYYDINKGKNKINNRLNFEIIIRFMLKNIGPNNTLLCLNDINIIKILKNIDNIDNIIYKELIQEKNINFKRDKLIYSVKQSLSLYLSSQYNVINNNNLNKILSNIKHSSDEWQLMSSVNVRPPTQRAAAPLEKNLTDLFIQFT